MTVAGDYRRKVRAGPGSLWMLAVLGVVAAVLVVAVLLQRAERATRERLGLESRQPVAIAATLDVQARRLAEIREHVKVGLVQRFETAEGSVPTAFVLLLWRAATLDQKAAVARQWFEYLYKLPKAEQGTVGKHVLSIRDAYTGQELGRFGPQGLEYWEGQR